MSNHTKPCLVALVLIFLHLSCTKLPQRQAAKEGDIAIERLTQANSIPSEWGKLVSVTNQPDIPSSVLLWFQDEKGDIHCVSFEINQKRLSLTAWLIPRK